MTRLRIVLADDHRMMREGLKRLIDSQSDMQVVGEAGDGRTTIDIAQKLNADVIVMDISMPLLNGFAATQQIKRLRPEMKVLILTRHADDSHLKQLFRAGVNGYVLKRSAADDLIRAIRAIAVGNTYVDPAMTQPIVERAIGREIPRGPAAQVGLSRREEEVLLYVARGYANKEIADTLFISIKTVETHRANATQKMGMTSRVDIVRFGFLQGWFDDM